MKSNSYKSNQKFSSFFTLAFNKFFSTTIDVIGASDTDGEPDEKETLKIPTPLVTPGSVRKHSSIIKKVIHITKTRKRSVSCT